MTFDDGIHQGFNNFGATVAIRDHLVNADVATIMARVSYKIGPCEEYRPLKKASYSRGGSSQCCHDLSLRSTAFTPKRRSPTLRLIGWARHSLRARTPFAQLWVTRPALPRP